MARILCVFKQEVGWGLDDEEGDQPPYAFVPFLLQGEPLRLGKLLHLVREEILLRPL